MRKSRCLALAVSPFLFWAGAFASTIPLALQPPASASHIGSFRGVGVQIYSCDASTKKWVLKAPEAVLSNDAATHTIRHFTGPSWQAEDGSKVVGKVIAEVPAPENGAVPWLLLAAVPSGHGFLAEVRFVQRIATKGGVAPEGPCVAGKEERVHYDAIYGFYR